MTRHDDFYARGAQTLEQIEILFARKREDVLDTFHFQALHEEIGCFHQTTHARRC